MVKVIRRVEAMLEWWRVPSLWKEAGCPAFSFMMDDAMLAVWQITRGPSRCSGWDGYVRGDYVDVAGEK